MSNAREAAFRALLACHRQGAWIDEALKRELSRAGLDARDAALAARLSYGVMQNQLLLDYYLAHFCRRSLEQMDKNVLDILRLGVYQLLFADRIPSMAAVNESVELTKRVSRSPRAPGFVNAVLRSIDRRRDALPPLPSHPPERLSVQYSHPLWMVEEFARLLPGAEIEALLAADNAQPPVCAQVNTCRRSAEEVGALLSAEGVEARAHPWLPNCLLLSETGDLSRLAAFQEGLFYIQDPAAHLAALAAEPRPGMRVLDACAAPGGKSFATAIAMEGRGTILACDIHPSKVRRIREGAARLGLDGITARVMDAREFDPALGNGFDLVIADVPCSGLGIIRKKPDIRYKDPGPLAELPGLQKAILDNVSRYVRPGGVLLYATCTLLERENGGVVDGFLAGHPGFALEPIRLPEPIGICREGTLTLWPHIHGTDGFYMAKLRRRG